MDCLGYYTFIIKIRNIFYGAFLICWNFYQQYFFDKTNGKYTYNKYTNSATIRLVITISLIVINTPTLTITDLIFKSITNYRLEN